MPVMMPMLSLGRTGNDDNNWALENILHLSVTISAFIRCLKCQGCIYCCARFCLLSLQNSVLLFGQ